jgi:uncharacterized protein YxeA
LGDKTKVKYFKEVESSPRAFLKIETKAGGKG